MYALDQGPEPDYATPRMIPTLTDTHVVGKFPVRWVQRRAFENHTLLAVGHIKWRQAPQEVGRAQKNKQINVFTPSCVAAADRSDSTMIAER